MLPKDAQVCRRRHDGEIKSVKKHTLLAETVFGAAPVTTFRRARLICGSAATIEKWHDCSIQRRDRSADE